MKCNRCGKDSTYLFYNNGVPNGCIDCVNGNANLVYPVGAGGPLLQGWQCPVCGSVYSPFVQKCDHCYCSNIHITQSDSATPLASDGGCPPAYITNVPTQYETESESSIGDCPPAYMPKPVENEDEDPNGSAMPLI